VLATDLLLDPFGATWPGMRAAALATERAGFDGIWTWDHLAGSVHREQRVLECWTVLSALAPLLERVAIGPLVLNVANRHPGLVAVMAATLQEVTGGRLLLGIGAGGGSDTPYAAEQAALGQPVLGDIARRRQVAEAIGVMRQLWTGRASPTEGRHFQLGSALGFIRPDPPPPIIVGAFGPKMAELAGRLGDGLNTQAAHPRLPDLIAVARRAHAGAGRDPGAFLVTAFAGLDRRWVEEGSHDRERLRSLGVERLVLLTHPPFDPDLIAAAGRLLGTASA
jgi:alkanesulfonate monooxygenase SsuD/methylene tetrahydromethanopterin reductase-like flavin-dependent oxidoreductase (luciferase family)